LLIASLGLFTAPGAIGAQDTPAALTDPSARMLIAGLDDALWLTNGSATNSRLFRRTTNEPFDLGRLAGRSIVRLTTIGPEVVGFAADGSIHRFAPDITDPIPGINLPGSALPVDVAGTETGIVALVARSALPTVGDNAPSRDAGEGLTVGRSDLRTWSLGPGLPSEVPATPGAARIGFGPQDLLVVVWIGPDQHPWFIFQASPTSWSAPEKIANRPLSSLWLVRVGNNTTLVGASQSEAAQVEGWRLLGDPRRAGASAWRSGALQFTEPLSASTQIRGATGFNQHVALLVDHGDSGMSIVFGRIDAKPTLAAVDVQSVIAQPTEVQFAQSLLTIVTFALLLAVLTTLFLFRRESMMKGVVLPPGCALASYPQRLTAWLIDFVPFLAAASYAFDIRILDGLVMLRNWGVGPEPDSVLADANLLLWWGLGCSGYVLYTCVMELLTSRTVGKVIARVYVLSESGSRASALQILTRNLTRLLELAPQFWVFALLVVLSRNQQRLGDIFARTYVARRLSPLSHGPPDATGSDSEPDDGSRENDRR
jgi:uncharacterized RDD family membrane protein YckC